MEEVLFAIVCFLSLIGIGLLIYISAQICTRPVRREKEICAACGYSREGLAPQWLCPECGAEPNVTAEWRLSAQSLIALFVPFALFLLVALSMAVYGRWGVVVGLHALIPMAFVAFVLMQIEGHVSPKAMVGYAFGATLPAAGLLGWASHMGVLFPDPLALLGLFIAWIYAIGAAGVGLGIGWLIERGMQKRHRIV